MKTDAEIQRDVMAELKWEPFINASEIGVAVQNGVVTLSGIVDTYSKKLTAEEAVKRITGVKAVAEDIEVRFVDAAVKSDTEIARRIADSLKWHSAVQEEKIKLTVENGWVTLEGQVDWEYQKNAVKSTIENLAGIKGISDLITVKPTVTAKDIKLKIASAFHRSAAIDSEKIQIEIIGNKAVLKGKVRSWIEKKEAQDAACNAPGITSVENKLDIDTEIFAY